MIHFQNEPTLLNIFDEITSTKPSRSPKLIANILLNELLKICNKNKIDVDDCKISSKGVAELVDMLESEETNLNLARLILEKMLQSSRSPHEIALENNWSQIIDDDEVKKFCENVLASDAGQKMVKQYKAGKTKVIFAIAGEISKKSDNRINMSKTMQILKMFLEK